jgi:hypothetical protein
VRADDEFADLNGDGPKFDGNADLTATGFAGSADLAEAWDGGRRWGLGGRSARTLELDRDELDSH